MKKFFLLAITLFAYHACSEDVNDSPLEESIIGEWSEMESHDTIIQLNRMNSLPDDEYGISFREKGKLMEWKNVGWCGTPPITYGKFEGNWNINTDSVLTMETEYWGGISIIEWRITEIDSKMMKYYLLSIQHIPDESEK